MRIVRNIVRKYAKESLRTGCIMGLGDLLAQTIIEEKYIHEVDIKRTLKFTTIGFCLVAPTLKSWYIFLDKSVPARQSRLMAGIKKMVLDQSIMAPTLSLLIMVAVDLIDRKSWSHIHERLRTQYIDVMKANYLLWPAVQVINFSMVPLAYQVLFVQLVAACWNCFLSQLLHSQKQTPSLK